MSFIDLYSFQTAPKEVQISMGNEKANVNGKGSRRAWLLLGLLVPLLSAITAVVWYYEGTWYGLAALYSSLVVVLLVKPGWRWFYIAAVTGPRDTM